MKKILKFLAIFLMFSSPALADNNYYNFVNTSTAAGTLNGTEQLAVTKGGSATYNTSSQAIANLFANSPYTLDIKNSPYNASGFIAQTATSTSVSSTTTSIPVLSSANFSAGQIVFIQLGGTGGTKNYAAYIDSIPDGIHINLNTSTAVSGAGLPSTATSGTTGLTTTVAAGTLVYSLGSTTLNGSLSNGATSVPVTNATNYAIGQGVLITAGAASGANLVTKITNIVGNTLTISPAISNASGVSSGSNVQHDDTAALQAAVNLVTVNQDVTIFFPDGVYQINGPALQGGTANGAVVLPAIPYYPNSFLTFTPMPTLLMTGTTPPPMSQGYLANFNQESWAGVIILTGISGYSTIASYGTSGSGNNIDGIEWIVRNMTFRSYPNPNTGGVNASHVAAFYADFLNIDTGETGQITVPTHNTLINGAIVGPINENGGNNVISNIDMSGYYYGIEPPEHGRMEHIRFDSIWVPVYFNWPASSGQYGNTGLDLQLNGCAHGFEAGQETHISFEQVNIEHARSPFPVGFANIDDINDTNNYISGFMSFDLLASPGPAVPTIVNAVNLHTAVYSSAAYPLDTQNNAGLSSSHYSSAPNGTMVYCSDCTIASPCAGSGSGALAKRLNGAWVCN